VNIVVITFWTAFWPACTLGFLPLFIAFATRKDTCFHNYFVITAFNIDGLSVNQGIGNRFACFLDNPSEGGPGNFCMGIPLGLK